MNKIYVVSAILLLATITNSVALKALKDDNDKYNDKYYGIVTGKVISSANKKPIQAVTVKIEGMNIGAYTNEKGEFTIKGLKSGEYSIRFSAVGYETYINTNTIITSAKPTVLEIELNEKVIELKGTEIRASYFAKNSEAQGSIQTLNSEDIRRAPGVQEDVVRATALLPGVGVTQAGRNDLVVRGGAPFENLFIVDNIEVPNINHFGTQGSSGGPLSIINIDFVKNVDFSAGAFGAKYGDKVSSITNIQLRNGNEEEFGGKAFLSATGFGLNLEGPLGNKGSYFLSVRRSYLDWIFEAAGFSFIPEYWDFTFKANYKLDEYNSLSFLTIGALGNVKLNNDNADNRFDNSRVAIPKQDQYFSGLTWKHLFETGFLTTTLGETFTKYNVFQNDSTVELNKVFKNKSTEAETSLKTDFDFQLDKHNRLLFGNQIKYADKLQYDINIPGYLRFDLRDLNNPIAMPLNVDSNFHTFKNATYFSYSLSSGRNSFTIGTHLDYFSYTQSKWYFSPRFSYSYQLNDLSSITLSGGRYYQSPSYIWLVGTPNQKLNAIRADQAVLGYEFIPMEDMKFQAEVFYKIYGNYPARIYRPEAVLAPSGYDDATNDIPYGLEPLKSNASGYSRGMEIFIQKKLSSIPLYGLISLTIADTKFKSIDNVQRPGAYDSRIIMNISLGYKLNEFWELSGKFRLADGLPSTDYLSNGIKNYLEYNEGQRYPLFHALDLRIDKRWIPGKYSLITYIDVQNVYGRQNVQGYRWNSQTQKVEASKSIGVLPSIGISFEF